MSALDHAIDVAKAYDASTVILHIADAQKLQDLIVGVRSLSERMRRMDQPPLIEIPTRQWLSAVSSLLESHDEVKP